MAMFEQDRTDIERTCFKLGEEAQRGAHHQAGRRLEEGDAGGVVPWRLFYFQSSRCCEPVVSESVHFQMRGPEVFEVESLPLRGTFRKSLDGVGNESLFTKFWMPDREREQAGHAEDARVRLEAPQVNARFFLGPRIPLGM